jgi:hypothetical protein
MALLIKHQIPKPSPQRRKGRKESHAKEIRNKIPKSQAVIVESCPEIKLR